MIEDGPAFNMSLVLVVSPSHADRLVLSGIVAGSGMKAVASPPAEAGAILDADCPFMVIADEGAEHADITRLMHEITARRRSAAGDLPLVVRLRSGNVAVDDAVADAVLAKPVACDVLHAQIARLVAQRR